ncbi:hypothetical protein [Luteolibacter luteus]|uniref:Uncharacterized protein n=1 Tax=Luteolibacter luteus TaxID=2728835 RepID=A0A858RMF7_9BACT|nr:hypothetical protein [Luteolibacter luteus]QJE98012.1 hypothetical protein HHL09_20205 [Luteolibacter luteus]
MSFRSILTACIALGVLVLVSKHKERAAATANQNPWGARGTATSAEKVGTQD